MQIVSDRDERVYVRWCSGGPWLVLDRDGVVSSAPHSVGGTPWFRDHDDETAHADRVAAAHTRRSSPPPRPAPRRPGMPLTRGGAR